MFWSSDSLPRSSSNLPSEVVKGSTCRKILVNSLGLEYGSILCLFFLKFIDDSERQLDWGPLPCTDPWGLAQMWFRGCLSDLLTGDVCWSDPILGIRLWKACFLRILFLPMGFFLTNAFLLYRCSLLDLHNVPDSFVVISIWFLCLSTLGT